MKTPILFSIVAGLTALPLIAADAPPAGAAKLPPPPPPSRLLLVLDADHDKIISAAELANATTVLTPLDKNADGQLTREEFCRPKPTDKKSKKNTGKPQKPSAQRPPPPDALVVALDTDKDHVISATELAAASTSLATLDKNADGQLTKDEFAPKPPRKPHGPDTDDDTDS